MILAQILFILAGKDDIHKRFDGLEIRPDQIRDHRVSLEQHLKIDAVPFFLFHRCGYTWEIVR